MKKGVILAAALVGAALLALAGAGAAHKKADDYDSCKYVSGENGPCGCLADPERCLYYSCTCCVAK